MLDKNGEPLRVRLTGDLYTEGFNANDYKPAAQTAYEDDAFRRNLRNELIYSDAMAYKTEQNRELYADAVAPQPLALDIRHITVEQQQTSTIAQTVQPQTQPTASKFRP